MRCLVKDWFNEPEKIWAAKNYYKPFDGFANSTTSAVPILLLIQL
jgi:hypothetical protein